MQEGSSDLSFANVPAGRARVTRLSKAFFMGSFGVGMLLFICLSVYGAMEGPRRGQPYTLLAWVPLIYVGVVMMILIYRMWAAIQDGHARFGPWLAVGLLLIPVFNVIWMFFVFWGFARDYNNYIARHEVPAPPLREDLFFYYVALPWFSVLAMCAGIPLLSLALYLVSLFVGLTMVRRICEAVNEIADWQATAISG